MKTYSNFNTKLGSSLRVLAFSAVFLTSCDYGQNNPGQELSGPAESGTTFEDNLASVGGDQVSRDQFESFLRFKRIPVDDTDRYEQMLSDYLERESLAKSIEETELLEKSMLETELNEFRKEMLISRYFQKFLNGKASDQEVRNYYNSNITKYQLEKARVAHILFRTTAQMDESERSVKLTAVREVQSRLSAGEEFSDLAQELSEDRISGEKGGDLGWLKQGSIDPRFSQTAFSLEQGAFSDIVVTPFGYHLITLLDGPAVVTQPFESVKGNIRYQLRSQAKEAELSRLKALVEIERR